MTKKLISIVIPVFNEEDNVAEMHSRLCAAMGSEPYEMEMIFVDDGSADATFPRLEELHAKDPRVSALGFSRNFGHQAAIFAGLAAARGQAVVMLDGDLQHPPEQIPNMIRRWEAGCDIVTMVREKDPGAGFVKNLTSALFYFIINRIGNVHIEKNAADFRLIDERVVRALCSMPERSRFLRGLISWVGFRSETLPYTAASRHAGATKYSFRKMLAFAMDAVVSFSVFPLRISAYLGLSMILLGMCYLVFTLAEKFRGANVPGWTSLMTVIILFSGVQLFMLGVIGEYLSRIYEETKRRPPYLVARSLGRITDGQSRDPRPEIFYD